jgi:autotransporter-associated beta strand protein
MLARNLTGAARSGRPLRLPSRRSLSARATWGFGRRKLRFETLENRRLLAVSPWLAGASLPLATSAATALDFNSNLYLFGGFYGTQAASSVYQLAPTATAWSTTTALNQGQAAGGVGETGYAGLPPNDGGTFTDIFTFGGVSQGQATAAVANYGSESTFASMSTPRSFFAYAADPGDTGSTGTQYLYAIGGLNASNQSLASVERYDVTLNTWTMAAPLPQSLSHATAADDGAGHILVFGGQNSSGAAVSTTYRYTVATNTWDTAAAMPAALSDASALYAAYGLIYVIGGKSAQGAVATVWDYNPVLDSWTADTSLPAAVYDAAAAIDANGNIDVIGGSNAAGAAVTNVWTTPVGQAPQNLPAYPMLTFPISYGNTNYFTYNGAPQQAAAFAYAADGATPVDGSFTYTYNISAAPPVNAGAYQVLAHFTSANPGYVDAYIAGQLVIDPAYPSIGVSGAGTFPYDGLPHPIAATEAGVDGTTPVSGSFSYTYNGSATPPLAPGAYSAVAAFTSSDPNYNSWTDPAPYSGNAITVTIPDPTIPTNFISTPTSTTSLALTWNAAWETDANLTPASSYTVTERVWHPGIHDPRGSGGTPGYWIYTTVASGITSTSYTITGLVAGSVHSYALNSVNSSGVAAPQTAYISAPTAVAPSTYYTLYSNGNPVGGYPPAEAETASYFTLVFPGTPTPAVTLVGGPATMSIDPATGKITYAPTESEVGYVTATFQATNIAGSVSVPITFHVLAHPILVVTGGTFTFDGQTHSAAAVAYARDGVTPLSGTVAFTYSPVLYPTAQSTAPYAESGSYIATATFTSSDANYGGATGTASINIVPANPTIVIDGGPFGYTGTPQSATAAAYGIDGVTPLDGSFQFTYDGSSTTPSLPGTYTVAASFTLMPNPYVAWVDYNNVSATGTMVILPNSAITVQSGTVPGGIQGAVSLIKTGSGSATLTGPNSYTGGTFVEGGTLIVTDPTALPDGGSIGVGSDAAFLAAATWASSTVPLPSGTGGAAASAAVQPAVATSAAVSGAAAPSVQPDATVRDRALLAFLAADHRPAAALLLVSPSSNAGFGSLSDRSHDVAQVSRTCRRAEDLVSW